MRNSVFGRFCGLLAVLASAGAQAAIPAGERAVLDALYTQTGGPHWTNNSGWEGATGSECTWHGITCDAGQTHVIYVSFSNNNLTGTLPSLTGLTKLQYFRDYVDHLTGPIPDLGGLTDLWFFELGNNQMTGAIPSLTGLTKLQTFEVAGNQLTGSIPDLTGLASLKYFDVRANQLTGTIPSLAGLTNLQNFKVLYNLLSGPIPAVPSPTNALTADGSSVCPNKLVPSADAAWDAATGSTPWYSACTGSLPDVHVFASAGPHGSISANATIDYGTATSLTVTPAAGYTAVVGGNCGGVLNGTTFTTHVLTYDCTVEASFVLSPVVAAPAVAAPMFGTIARTVLLVGLLLVAWRARARYAERECG